MKKTTISGLLILLLALITISGCIGDNNVDETPPPAVQPVTAVVKISTSGTSTLIGAIDVTVVLPAGVTVKATVDNNKLKTDTGVVAVSGVAIGSNAHSVGTYTAATTAEAGKVTIMVANADGFTAGEFVTVNCDIAAGSFPTTAEFSLTAFSVLDRDGVAITTLTPGFTADIN